MRKQLWIGLVVAIAVFLGAVGAVLAATFLQASREVDSTLTFRAVNVLADENLGIYHDAQGTDPVTFLEFPVLDLQPPLRRAKESGAVSVYIRNESDSELSLIEPCGDVLVDGLRIGLMDPELFDSDEKLQGRMCDRPGVKLAPGQMVRARVSVDHLDPNLEPADYAFTTVFGAVGQPIQPPDGMVSWWPGDGNANDILDGNNGTLTGDFAEGMVGQGFSFDGTGDLVLVPDSANLNITGDVAVDLWAKRTVFGGIAIMVDKGAGAVGGLDVPSAYALWFGADDRLNGGFERGDASNVSLVGPAVTDEAFHHYAYVRSGNTHELFMDGEVAASGDFTGRPGDTSGIPLAIGALLQDLDPADFGSLFGGVIDEVEIFNRALSAEEIKAIYEAGSAGKIKPPQPAPTPIPTPTPAPVPTATPAPVPTVALSYNPARDVRNADTLTITATFSVAMRAAPTVAIDTTGTNLAATNMTGSDGDTVWTFSYNVPSGSDGTATVTIAGTDLAGNANDAATNATFTIDNTAPTVALTYNPDRTMSAGETLIVTATFNEPMNATPTIAINTTGDDQAATNMTDSGNQTVWTFSYNVPSGSDGVAAVTIAGTDLAGNSNDAATNAIFTIDNTAPSVAITYDPDRNMNAGETLTITATFSEAVSGTPTIFIDTVGTDLAATSMTDSGNQTVWTFSYNVPSGSDGAAAVTIAGTDLAGNANDAATNATFTIESAGPPP